MLCISRGARENAPSFDKLNWIPATKNTNKPEFSLEIGGACYIFFRDFLQAGRNPWMTIAARSAISF
jgi:hypothetical protein